MSLLPAPDRQKEDDYVADRERRLFWNIPPALSWLGMPLLGAVAATAATSTMDLPIPPIAGLAAAVLGLLLGRRIAGRIPQWNDTRHKAFVASSRKEFHEEFKATSKKFEQLAAHVEQLRQAVNAKSYKLYVPRLKTAEQCRGFRDADVEVFYEYTPSVLTGLSDELDHIIRDVESDPRAVTAYAPHLLDKVWQLKGRAAVGNILDCYHLARELDEMFERIADRSSPFDFSPRIQQLREEVQECRDTFLSDPRRERVWREIQYKDERLKEQRRHNKAMEEAAEAEAEAARQTAALDEERNDLLRQQRDAQRVTAAGTVATALYTRKTANAARELADRTRESSD